MNVVRTVWYSAIFRGALVGALTAARIDYLAFKSWKSFDEIWVYNWRTAAFRWFQGAIVGSLTSGAFASTFPEFAVFGE